MDGQTERCAHCGTPSTDGGRFCINCGAELAGKWCAQCGQRELRSSREGNA